MIANLSRKLQQHDPETAQHLAVLGLNLFPPEQNGAPVDGLSQQVWGTTCSQPVMLTCGQYKEAQVFHSQAGLGISFTETGSGTPAAQRGNPRPGLIRLKDAGGIINRYEFNSRRKHCVRRSEEKRFSYLRNCVIDGVIITNTTCRKGLSDLPAGTEPGGLSGKPLQRKKRGMLCRACKALGHSESLVTSGSINSSGEDVYLRICTGATLCQIHTAFDYEGSSLIPHMLEQTELSNLRDGFISTDQARGTFHVRHPE